MFGVGLLSVMDSNLASGSRMLLVLSAACVIVLTGTANQASGTTPRSRGPTDTRATVVDRNNYRFGRLIVQRSADFGNALFLNLSINGRHVANIAWNYRYDAWIPAGHHVVTVLAVPRSAFRRPSSRRVTIVPGRTHIFTGVWESDRVVLQRSSRMRSW